MIQIAIDGPAGSGKSTTAKKIAQLLGINYMDTGAMYRAVAYEMMKRGVDLTDIDKINAEIRDIDLTVSYSDGAQHISIDGRDVTDKLRTPEVSAGASAVAKAGKVREYLVSIQQKTANQYDMVMDGRDIGTVVLPDSPAKFFMTASVDERARRRQAQLKAAGVESDFETLKSEIAARDKNDSEREISPLRMAADAVLIDNSNLSEEDVNGMILSRVREIYKDVL